MALLPPTPNGCKRDNGRAFSSIQWDANFAAAAVLFTDGSGYLMWGLTEQETNDWRDMEDPGCFFNFNLSRRATYRYLRVF